MQPDLSDRYRLKLGKMMAFAQSLASLSCCKRLQVGCIVVPPDFSNVLSIGYNGPPSGLPNDQCSSDAGSCGCVHAEANAIVKLGACSNAMLLCTDSPCMSCTGLIINSKKISHVVYLREYRDFTATVLLQRVMQVDHYDSLQQRRAPRRES